MTEWTTEIPATPGFYWAKLADWDTGEDTITVVKIYDSPWGMRYWFMGYEPIDRYAMSEGATKFAGPIEPPQLPSKKDGK